MKKVSKLLQIMNQAKKPVEANGNLPDGLIFYRGDSVTAQSKVALSALVPGNASGIKVTTAFYVRGSKPVISVDASIIPFLSGHFGTFDSEEALIALQRFESGQDRYIKKVVYQALKAYEVRR